MKLKLQAINRSTRCMWIPSRPKLFIRSERSLDNVDRKVDETPKRCVCAARKKKKKKKRDFTGIEPPTLGTVHYITQSLL
jgi:hypothetical protein